jgi:hypothetical protein
MLIMTFVISTVNVTVISIIIYNHKITAVEFKMFLYLLCVIFVVIRLVKKIVKPHKGVKA